MNFEELNYYYNKFKFGEDNFHNLMKKRVKEILLVSSFYDAYIFEQDGRLSEQIFGEYEHLNLHSKSKITSVPNTTEALKKFKKHDYDLVISMLRVGETIPYELSSKIKEISPETPVFLLVNNNSDMNLIKRHPDKMRFIDNVFYWSGDSKLFIAMIKYVEDKWNCDYDTSEGHVRVILLVEDSVNFYSTYLPMLYTVVMRQTQLLIKTEMNDNSKSLRMRARPKVLMVHNYEDALKIYNKYKEFIVCVISDIDFPMNNKHTLGAGLKLLKYFRENDESLPIIMQSSNPKYEDEVKFKKANFVKKNDKHLMSNLKKFINKNLGYGDFIFKDDDGHEYERAKTLREFETALWNIPNCSLVYHALNNDFSNWLLAHGEFLVAEKIKPMSTTEFDSLDDLRNYLMNIFLEVNNIRSRGKISNFDKAELGHCDQIIKFSDGSLGGKGRGLAFINSLLISMDFNNQYKDVNISVPSSCIIGTNDFDDFIEKNNLDIDFHEFTDEHIKNLFINGTFSDEFHAKIDILLDSLHKPLAIRSSSLLEDSQAQPFAGIYSTYMLPNSSCDINKRKNDLLQAIKLVYSSIYMEKARNYIENVNYMVEEEKMAVVIQEVVGSRVDDWYFPTFSGVAQSFNFYPTSGLKNEDGIATLAVGMGKSVVEGEHSFRFCPKYPKKQISSFESVIGNSQKNFWGININCDNYNLNDDEDVCLSNLSIRDSKFSNAYKDVISLYNLKSKKFVYDKFEEGIPVVTFNNVVKFNKFPLSEILKNLLVIGEMAMGIPVEIEFSVDLNSENSKPTFYILQIRPLSINSEEVLITDEDYKDDKCILASTNAMGNGIIDNINHIVFVKPESFDNTQTLAIMEEIKECNKMMRENDLHYILIGPGRWGTRDRFLGVPVAFSDISRAKVIIESGLENFRIDPSQGTHFFHNVLSMNIGYISVPYGKQGNEINWQNINNEEIVYDKKYIRVIKSKKTIKTKMDGKKGIAVIIKS